MKNEICSGNIFDVTATADIASGELVLVGGLVGVAATDIANTETGSVCIQGVFEVPKAAGVVAQGAKLYYDSATKNLTTTVGANTFAGYAYQAAANGDATVQVKLIG